ncbi:MAG: hypothetical protein M3Z36_12260, partial [Acidobacteriota bacterium]|nr:hypothetical protein [Acidobacteriota bacterium]
MKNVEIARIDAGRCILQKLTFENMREACPELESAELPRPENVGFLPDMPPRRAPRGSHKAPSLAVVKRIRGT